MLRTAAILLGLAGLAAQASAQATNEAITDRLKARTPKYRSVQLAPEPPKPAATGVPTGTGGPAKSRMLGDTEKQALPPGTVFTVDGMPVLEQEVRDLSDYFATYAPAGAENDNWTRATTELIKVRTVQAAYRGKLPELEAKIAAVLKEAQQEGANFSDIAKAHSNCPSAKDGGDLREFGRESMVPTFARHAFSVPVGQLSPVFASWFGYHFLKVTGKQKGATPAGDMVTASHVLIQYDDSSKILPLVQKAETAQVEVAVVSAEWRAKLPQAYR